MFQTFSGSSRRPRQVNLSGQNINPFAASSWTPAASGTQKTVAHAQQERQQRQQEREKLNASRRIQRTWRGHKARRELADSRRRLWDAENTSGKPIASFSSFLLLFVAFFNPRRSDDIDRLESLSQRISQVGFAGFLTRQDVQPYLLRLAKLSLEALRGSGPGSPVSILELLIAIIDSRPQIFAYISREYYGFLSKLASDQQFSKLDGKLVIQAIKTPLAERIQIEDDLPSTSQLNAEEMTLDAHAGFALYFLTTPDLQTLLGGLDELAESVDVGVLSAAIVREFLSGSAYRVKAESRLWLLAHFIALHRLQQRTSQDSQFLRGLSLQLSSSSTEIVGRIDATETAESSRGSQDGDASPLALPPFIKNELSALVNQDSIVSLIERFDVGHAKNSAAGEEDASLLASYALSLLRIFPSRADELRMWLYLGSMDTPSRAKLPALKFFWQAVSLTTTFSAIMGDSKAALRLLRPQIRQSFSLPSPSDIQQDREWRTILLFLELYTFVLRFTDDEEFLSGGAVNLQSSDPISRIRESALPIEDVKRLTIFLKNLAFTSYFNAGELADDEEQPVESSLGSYFGTNVAAGRSSRFTSQDDEVIVKNHARRPFAGVAGMTFEYVRTVVTGVMRMLYERDSRRRFLPKDHWLMTSRFDMDGFITAVVMEEERRREVTEGDEDEDADVDGDDLPMLQDRLVGIDRHRRAFQIEKQRKQQQKAARKKVLAVIGPRVEVLQNMPFVIPFETRVQIFRQFVHLDQSRRRGGNVDPDIWRFSVMHQTHSGPGQHRTGREILSRHHAKIRRDNIFQDAYEQFYELGEGLKEPIQITFVDQFDTAEAGIDGGGVTKEFLTSITNEAFRSSDGPNLFVTNDQNLLYPNPTAIDERQQLLKQAGFSETTAESREHIKELLKQYEFLGRVVGKCLYEGILIDLSFAGFFLLKWAASAGPGYRASINDLRDLDEDFYQNLLKLKNFTGDVEDLSLDFTITDVVSPPGAPTVTLTRDLRPNGSRIAVTNENRPLYVSYVARHRLTVQPYQQTQAFLKGLGEIIEPSWLSMFNQTELQTLIGGDASEIDVDDLRANTAYGGVYQIGDDGLEHPTVQLFWRVMKQLDDSDRRKVLKYVTSTPRAPLLGFAQLNPRFSIRDAGADEERLPSTSTCVNLLKLPRYSTEVVLRNKLLYAVNSGAGFDLS